MLPPSPLDRASQIEWMTLTSSTQPGEISLVFFTPKRSPEHMAGLSKVDLGLRDLFPRARIIGSILPYSLVVGCLPGLDP